MSSRVSFSHDNSPFTAALRSKVNEYFASARKPMTGNSQLYVKTAILFASAAALYVSLVFITLPVWLSVFFCALLGMNLAAIGFNVMHDGSHGSFSKKKWVNTVMSYSLNLMGGSAYFWKQKHNEIHHSFTNLEGIDDDIDIRPFMRTNEAQPRYWFHRFQHIYWVLLYGLGYLAWIITGDFAKYFTMKIGGIRIRRMSVKEHIIFWGSKLLYGFFFFVLPVFTQGFLATLLGYFIMAFVCGWVISIVFQLAHVVEETDFPAPAADNRVMPSSFTVHQLLTTANFATKNKVITWLLGGLNFQVEHHLFPKISHVHYPEISKVVKDVCRSFNVPYNEYPGFFCVVKSHVRHLRKVGRV